MIIVRIFMSMLLNTKKALLAQLTRNILDLFHEVLSAGGVDKTFKSVFFSDC